MCHERLSQSLHSSVGCYQSVPTTNTRGALHIVVMLIVSYQVHDHVTWENVVRWSSTKPSTFGTLITGVRGTGCALFMALYTSSWRDV